MAFVAGFGVVKQSSKQCTSQRRCGFVVSSALDKDVRDDTVVKFRTREEGKNLNLLNGDDRSRVKSKSELILEQIEETKLRLGVIDEDKKPIPKPVQKVDLSKINVFYGFGSAAFTFTLFFGLLSFTNILVEYYGNSPFTSDVYIVRRIYGVVKTAMLTIFSLATGITGVTGLGIFLLSCQVAYMRLTGQFDKK